MIEKHFIFPKEDYAYYYRYISDMVRTLAPWYHKNFPIIFPELPEVYVDKSYVSDHNGWHATVKITCDSNFWTSLVNDLERVELLNYIYEKENEK